MASINHGFNAEEDGKENDEQRRQSPLKKVEDILDVQIDYSEVSKGPSFIATVSGN